MVNETWLVRKFRLWLCVEIVYVLFGEFLGVNAGFWWTSGSEGTGCEQQGWMVVRCIEGVATWLPHWKLEASSSNDNCACIIIITSRPGAGHAQTQCSMST